MTPEQEQEMKEAQAGFVAGAVENVLNFAVDQMGMNNDDLKQILQQVIVDIDRGFVGEPC